MQPYFIKMWGDNFGFAGGIDVTFIGFYQIIHELALFINSMIVSEQI